MKTEDFDDAIKRKLESINPTVDEKEILRVHRYTVINRSPFSMLRSTRVFWPLMAIGMLITGLATWKLTTMFAPGQNQKHIVTVKPATVQPETKQAVKIVTKTDTVYVTKYKNKYSDIHLKQKGFMNKAAGSKTSRIASTEDYNKGLTSPLEIDKKAVSHVEFTSNKISGKGYAAQESATQENSQGKGDNLASPQNGSAVQKVDPVTNKAKSVTEINKAKKDSVNSAAQKLPVHNYSDEHKKTPTKAPLKFGFMAGAGLEGASTQFGGGILTRLLFNDRISLNVGLKVMSIKQKYDDDDNFDKATGYNFDKAYGVPNYCHAANINMAYTLWQIPLAIEYDIPLPLKGFSFSIAAGTDLDLNCKAGVHYDEVDYGGNTYANPTVSRSYVPVTFNNIVISPGIIKQFGPIVVQFSGFVSPQIENAWYKGNEAMFYGGNFKIFYRF